MQHQGERLVIQRRGAQILCLVPTKVLYQSLWERCHILLALPSFMGAKGAAIIAITSSIFRGFLWGRVWASLWKSQAPCPVGWVMPCFWPLSLGDLAKIPSLSPWPLHIISVWTVPRALGVLIPYNHLTPETSVCFVHSKWKRHTMDSHLCKTYPAPGRIIFLLSQFAVSSACYSTLFTDLRCLSIFSFWKMGFKDHKWSKIISLFFIHCRLSTNICSTLSQTHTSSECYHCSLRVKYRSYSLYRLSIKEQRGIYLIQCRNLSQLCNVCM